MCSDGIHSSGHFWAECFTRSTIAKKASGEMLIDLGGEKNADLKYIYRDLMVRGCYVFAVCSLE